jgi:hypothetical protein
MSLDFSKKSLEIKIVLAADRDAQLNTLEETKEKNLGKQISQPDRDQ